MKTKKIYLIRHGETQYNKLGIVQGSGVDTDLNQDGIAQADAFYEGYKHINFDKVYTSKLKRTSQTVSKFIEISKIPHQSLWGLNEISWGSKEGRRTTTEEDKSYFEMLHQWRKGNIHAKSNGGESPWEVSQRQRIAWNYIMSNWQEQTILVCMHGRAIRILLCELLRVPIWEMDTFSHSNTCLYLLQFENNAYRIELANDTSHLKILESKVL